MAPVNATMNEKEKISQNSDRKLINSLGMFYSLCQNNISFHPAA